MYLGDLMGPVGKLVIGLVFIALGLAALGGDVLRTYGVSVPLSSLWLPALIIVVAGTLPAFLILVGLFVVWIELEELKSRPARKRKR